MLALTSWLFTKLRSQKKPQGCTYKEFSCCYIQKVFFKIQLKMAGNPLCLFLFPLVCGSILIPNIFQAFENELLSFFWTAAASFFQLDQYPVHHLPWHLKAFQMILSISHTLVQSTLFPSSVCPL
mmetsp:Transcript_3002/g.3942  ORF Transcript_3002/g.3942 Transcript_3002/m.3942 type:complete len:125 (+) Transcript_3002:31-405(+)